MASMLNASHLVRMLLFGGIVIELGPSVCCGAGTTATDDEGGQSAYDQSTANSNSNADAYFRACGQAG